ncbi:MAG TPA: hypothetical protein DCZ55_18245, partial [Cyanobacteria bacterium UBA11371]|nr:hypothetical protein [Cyanobacteria bacterium UBA11371]
SRFPAINSSRQKNTTPFPPGELPAIELQKTPRTLRKKKEEVDNLLGLKRVVNEPQRHRVRRGKRKEEIGNFRWGR